ncbi:MAG: conjugative transfer signal peptidase TraF [bacterium]|nr:conjugative transfer signal peptidase TraF [bacterium]
MRRPRSWAPLWVLVGAAGLGGLFVGSGLRLNWTKSLPLGLYRLAPGALERGALVAVCLPLEHGLEGRRRGYLLSGPCPGDASPVLKTIGATGGDVVSIRAGGVLVNGEPFQVSAPRRDLKGRRLDPLPPDDYELEPGQLWLFTSEPRSWDSRFYGPVESASVLGRVQPIWTRGHDAQNRSERPRRHP